MDSSTIISLARRHGLLDSPESSSTEADLAYQGNLVRFAMDIRKIALETLAGECKARKLDMEALLGHPICTSDAQLAKVGAVSAECAPADAKVYDLPPLSESRRGRIDELLLRWESRCQGRLSQENRGNLARLVHMLGLVESSLQSKAQNFAEANWKRLDMVMQDLAKGIAADDEVLVRRASLTLGRLSVEVDMAWTRFRLHDEQQSTISG